MKGETGVKAEKDSKPQRIFCVDFLRGLDIFYLAAIHYALLSPGVFRVWPLESTAAKVFWVHSITAFTAPGQTPTGFGLLDFTQALFIFVTGVSASLAFRKFLLPDGQVDLRSFWKRLLQRTFMLWALGSLIRGVLTFKLFFVKGGVTSCVLYSDTLHTIAVAYCAASVGMLIGRRWLRLAVALAPIASAALVMAFCGDYSQHGNAARIFEEFVYGKFGGCAKDFCYLLTTLTWAGMGILASLAGDIVKGALAPWSKVKALCAFGIACMALGWVLSVWIPPIRYIYTASFVFLTQGGALILLAALYALTDIANVRRGTGIFLLFGQCSLAAWMLIQFFGPSLTAAAERFVVGVPELIGTNHYQPFFVGLARTAILVTLVWMWRRYRRGLRALISKPAPSALNK